MLFVRKAKAKVLLDQDIYLKPGPEREFALEVRTKTPHPKPYSKTMGQSVPRLACPSVSKLHPKL